VRAGAGSHALEQEDWAGVGIAIQKEWQIRKTLAAGISTPAIDRAIETAQGLGATAAKVCGAGGGGCFFVYSPSGNSRTVIAQKLVEQGMTVLPISTVAKGLTVTRG
jgi:D-glycero-alpha-D-manno-heptose-7-phosphate kinase